MEVQELIKYFIQNHFHLTQYASYIIVETKESNREYDVDKSKSIVDLHFLDDYAFDYMFMNSVLGNNHKYKCAAIETFEELDLNGQFEPNISVVNIHHHFFFRSHLIPRGIIDLDVRIRDKVYLPKQGEGSISRGNIDGDPLDWSTEEVRQIISQNLLMARVRMQAPDASLDQLTEMIISSGFGGINVRN